MAMAIKFYKDRRLLYRVTSLLKKSFMFYQNFSFILNLFYAFMFISFVN